MSYFPYSAVMFAPMKRSVAVAALTGAMVLAGPLAPAFAQSSTPAPAQQTQPSAQPAQAPTAHQNRAERHAETVEQRITTLHAELKITPAEETDWQAVAKTMRDNAAALQKLVAEKSSQKSVTAVEDLQIYQQFAETHVEGLKNLVASFQTLYNSMPAAQQKLADQVFQRSRG